MSLQEDHQVISNQERELHTFVQNCDTFCSGMVAGGSTIILYFSLILRVLFLHGYFVILEMKILLKTLN